MTGRAERQSLGYDVLEAVHGGHALQVLDHTRVERVLTDMYMPVVDGIELTRHIRADRRLAGLPVVLTSCRDGTHDRQRALRAGAAHFLTKPIGGT